jgi:hypothetical protein
MKNGDAPGGAVCRVVLFRAGKARTARATNPRNPRLVTQCLAVRSVLVLMRTPALKGADAGAAIQGSFESLAFPTEALSPGHAAVAWVFSVSLSNAPAARGRARRRPPQLRVMAERGGSSADVVTSATSSPDEPLGRNHRSWDAESRHSLYRRTRIPRGRR